MHGTTPEMVVAASRTLTGDLLQVPPMVSALKVDGVRLHALARQGVEVERAARPVRVDRFEVEPLADATGYRFVVTCSSGTYVRSLVDDLGRLLGGGAHMTSLRRTAVGTFGIDEAATLSAIADATDPEAPSSSPALLSPAQALRHLPTVLVDHDGAARVATGRTLEADDDLLATGSPVAVLGPSGELLAVYEPKGGMLAAAVVLAGGGA